jgi:SnoaL-like domain
VCFAPDAQLTFVSTSTVLEGCDAIRTFLESALGNAGSTSVSTYFMGNSSIVLEPDDRCRVRTAAVVYPAVADDAGMTMRGTPTRTCAG